MGNGKYYRKATILLLTKLEEGEQSAREKGRLTADEVEAALESAVYPKKEKVTGTIRGENQCGICRWGCGIIQLKE